MKKQTPNHIILINTISAGLLNGISMIMMPVYSYLLGPDNYGLASIYTTWSSILAIIIGVQAAASLAVAQKDFSKEEQLPFQANGVYLGLVMTVILSAFFLLFSGFLSDLLSLPRWSILLLCPHAFGIFCIGMLNSKFTYEFKQDKNLVLSVGMSLGTALVSVIAILLMVPERRYFGKVIGTAVPQVICGIGLLIFLLKRVGLCIKREYLQYIVRYSLPLVFSNLCVHLFASSDKLMLQKLVSNSEVGIYSLAFNFAGVLSSIWYALNHAWGPFYYKYEAAGNTEELLYHIKNYTRLFSILTMGFILLSPEIFEFFAAPAFYKGKNLIPVFAIGFYFNFVSCFARNHQYYYKDTKSISLISIGVSVLNLVLNLFLIPYFGGIGAAIATAFSQLFGFIGNWSVARILTSKVREFPCKLAYFIKYLFAIFVSIFLFYLPMTWALRWALALILGLYLLKKLLNMKQIF